MRRPDACVSRRDGNPRGLEFRGVLSSAEIGEALVTGLAPRHWYRADTYTLSGSNLATLPNRNTTVGGALVMAAGTLSAPASDGALGGAHSVTFNAAEYLDSNLAASEFLPMGDGTGCEVLTVWVPTTIAAGTQYLWSTRNSSGAAQQGASMYRAGAIPGALIANAAGSAPWNGLAGTAVVGQPILLHSFHKFTDPVSYGVFNGGTLTASGTSYTTAPSGVNPAGFRLGAAFTTPLAGAFRWAETMVFYRVLTEFERQQVREYIQARYGIAAPSVSALDKGILALSPFSWPRADYYATSGGKITALSDRAMPGHTYAQASGVLQAADPAVDALLNGQLSVTFNGSFRYQSSLAAAQWAHFHDGTGYEMFFPFVPTSTSLGYLWATYPQTGAAAGSATFRNGTGQPMGVRNATTAIVSSVNHGTLANNTASYLNSYYASASTPQYSVALKEVVGASGTPTGAPSVAAASGAFMLAAATDGQFPGFFRWAEALIFKRVLSSADRAQVRAYLSARYAL